MMIPSNNGASVPPQRSYPLIFTVDDEQKMKTERKDYIEVARFLFGDNWQFTKKILTFDVDSGNRFNFHLVTPSTPELLKVGKDLAFAYRTDIPGKNTMGGSRYTYMEKQINESDIYAILDVLRYVVKVANLEIYQLDDSICPFVAEFRHPDFVNTIWSDHPSAPKDTHPPATYLPRVIKLMRVLYDDAQWEYTKLALEWGFDRTNYTRIKVTRLYTEGCKVAEEYRRLLTSKNIAAEEVNSVLLNYLDESCFDINEADVEATLDIVQAWDYYMSRDGDKISKFLDDIRDVDKD